MWISVRKQVLPYTSLVSISSVTLIVGLTPDTAVNNETVKHAIKCTMSCNSQENQINTTRASATHHHHRCQYQLYCL